MVERPRPEARGDDPRPRRGDGRHGVPRGGDWIGDDGKLISTDFASGMVEAAKAADALGLDNVEHRVLDAERMDLDDSSVDGVLCRFGYMLMADPATALAETRRVLRDGGRLVFASGRTPDENLWAFVPGRCWSSAATSRRPSPSAGDLRDGRSRSDPRAGHRRGLLGSGDRGRSTGTGRTGTLGGEKLASPIAEVVTSCRRPARRGRAPQEAVDAARGQVADRVPPRGHGARGSSRPRSHHRHRLPPWVSDEAASSTASCGSARSRARPGASARWRTRSLAELRGLGVEVERGRRAAEAGAAGAGNLIARVPGRGEGWVMFCAHLDTVPDGGAVEVELDDGVYRSRGETILGADNKAAVAVLVELAGAARRATRRRSGLELVFTVAEEDGLRGAKAFDLALRSRYGLRARPRDPDRRGDHRRRPTSGSWPSSRAPRRTRDPARGRAQRDRGGGGRDRRDGARPARRRDDRERRRDRRRDGSNVVAGPLPDRGRGAQHRRAEGGETIGAMVDACTWAASERPLRRRRRRDRDVPRLPAGAVAGAASRREGGARALRVRAARDGDRRRQRRERADRAAASTASCSPTAPRRTTPRRRAWPRRGSSRCSRSARRSPTGAGPRGADRAEAAARGGRGPIR